MDDRPALLKARRAWKCLTADVYRARVQKDGAPSSWLKDHGGRPTRGVKAADQLLRLVDEMEGAGFSLDRADQLLVAYVRGLISMSRLKSHITQPGKPAA